MTFGFYFIFQHSFNAWSHLKLGLDLNSKQLFKKSFFYNISAFALFILILFFGNQLISFEGVLGYFFIFIACISFPHFIIMHIFYKSITKDVL